MSSFFSRLTRNEPSPERRSAGPSKSSHRRRRKRERPYSPPQDEFGLFTLWPPAQKGDAPPLTTHVDIVAIHGLAGDPFLTWKSEHKIWLRDFLPSDISRARIMTFGYNSQVAFSSSASGLDDFAISLLEELIRKRGRDGTSNNPIIFVCHSLGGIVFKKALIIAHERQNLYASLSRSITGVVFMGTPHRGSDIAYWARIFGNLCRVPMPGSIRTELLQDLETKSETLGQVCSQFVERGAKLDIVTIYERKKMTGLNSLIVDKDSALLHLPNETPRPIEADHIQMCKFPHSRSQGYLVVLDYILRLIDSARTKGEKDSEDEDCVIITQHLRDFGPEIILREIEPPLSGTCDWITREDGFRAWRMSSDRPLLCIHGPPGAGKTAMMRDLCMKFAGPTAEYNTVLDDPEEELIVAFFYCSSKDSLRTTAKNLWRSVLYQILSASTSLFHYLPKEVRRDSDLLSSSACDIDVLLKCLHAVLQHALDKRFLILIDGLDELSADERGRVHAHVEALVLRESRVKLVLSNRQLIRFSRSPSPIMSPHEVEMVGDEIESGVKLFIHKSVKLLRANSSIPKELCKHVEREFIRLVSSNFLLAKLAWENFATGVEVWTENKIETRLVSLQKTSPDLESHYCELLRRIGPDARQQARKIFELLLTAKAPLTIQSLKQATAINVSHRRIADVERDLPYGFIIESPHLTAYLLKIDRHNVVTFKHQSVVDLLTAEGHSPNNDDVLTFFKRSSTDHHREWTKITLTILQYADFESEVIHRALLSESDLRLLQNEHFRDRHTPYTNEMDIKVNRIPLLRYSIENWAVHASLAEEYPDVVQLASAYTKSWQCRYFRAYLLWDSGYRFMKSHSWTKLDIMKTPPPTAHLLLSCGDFGNSLEALLQHDDANSVYSDLSLLSLAVRSRRLKAFNFLLSLQCVDLNLAAAGNTPLHHCLKSEVDKGMPNPLHDGEKIGREMLMSLVTDKRVNINMKDNYGNTPLHCCCGREQPPGIVESLLGRPDIDVNAINLWGKGPFANAFENYRRGDLVRRLLDRSDLVIDFSQWSDNPFIMADMWGWSDVEKHLMDRYERQFLASRVDQLSVLEWYALHGRKAKVLSLLDRLSEDAVVSSQTRATDSLVHLSAQHGWRDIFDTLRYRFHCSIDGHDSHGRTVLHYAAEYCWTLDFEELHHKTVEWLDWRDRDGLSALHIAVLYHNAALTTLLLQNGASHVVRDKYGKTPVHLAAEENCVRILHTFFQYPLREYGRDEQKRGVLHYLAMWGDQEVIRTYIRAKRAIVDIIDASRRTPLHYATIFGNAAAMEELLNSGAEPSRKDGNGVTVVQYALRAGRRDLLDICREHGADVSIHHWLEQCCYVEPAATSDVADSSDVSSDGSGRRTSRRRRLSGRNAPQPVWMETQHKRSDIDPHRWALVPYETLSGRPR